MANASSGILLKYFPDLSTKQRAQFDKLEALYAEWNAQINVISRKDQEHLYTKHVLHSLGIAKIIKFKPEAEILDVGTGGGFPGIPLAILFPESNFHLVDSIGKKIKVVKGIADSLNLENVFAEQTRAEELKGKYDFVVSRAVTRLKPFRHWVRKNYKAESVHKKKNGIFYLKGGDLMQELKEAKCKNKVYNLSDYFEEEFFDTKMVVYVPA